MPSKPFVIVVGFDYSELAELALTRALELAARETLAQVHVLSIIRPLQLDPMYPAPASAADSAPLADLATTLERLRQHVHARVGAKPVSVVSHVRIDSPSWGIAQLAADLEADLVVVGTHGRTGFSRVLMGSVAEAVVRLAPCPVLVVRPKALPPAEPVIAPPCPRCVEARQASAGGELWCEQHREHHGRRHTYHQGDRAGAETNMPLVFR